MADGKIQQVMMQSPLQVKVSETRILKPHESLETASDLHGSKWSTVRNSICRAKTTASATDCPCFAEFKKWRDPKTHPPPKPSRQFEQWATSHLRHQQQQREQQ